MSAKNKTLIFSLLLLLAGATSTLAQNLLRGNITDAETGETLIGAHITVRETGQMAAAEADGSFEIRVNGQPPFTLLVTMTGYADGEQTVTSLSSPVAVRLAQAAFMAGEVVVSASRVEERIMQSPVTIERLGSKELRQGAAATFYNEIPRLKGVSYTEQSLGWISVQPRFLGSSGNTGLLQLVDGMDMTAAVLGFPIGNLAGISDLDVRSVELVPGAASALYGANAFDGALLIYSKNPFDSPGLSAQVKTGFTTSDAGGSHPYNAAAIRWAQTFKGKFGYKINLTGMWGEEWRYNDYDTDRNSKTTDRTGAPNFDGLHRYGDETQIFLPFQAPQLLNPLLDALTPQFSAATGIPEAQMRPILQGNISQLNPIQITRTGYRDEDLLDDNKVKNMSAMAGLFYRFNPDLELSYNFGRGTGSATYVGADKYILRNVVLQTNKLELRGKNFFARAYAFNDDAGDSYNLTALGAFLNEAYSPSASQWVPTYAGTYAGALMQIVLTQGITPDQLTDEMLAGAHQAARQAADANRPQPGTAEFDEMVKTVRETRFKQNGAHFVDQSRHYHAEALYDFSPHLGDLVSLQMGGNVRRYSLFTDNTVFNEDPDGEGKSERIGYNEFGGFVQASRNFLGERLKLNGSLRYDKNENFDGQVSPRLSAGVFLGAKKQVSLRASWQTGFQNPTADNMWIYFPVGSILLGNVPENSQRYGLHDGGSWTKASYDQYVGALLGGASPDDAAQLLQTADLDYIRPQQVKVWEGGIRALLGKKLYADLNVFHHNYKHLFVSHNVVNINPTTHGGQTIPTGTSWSVRGNAADERKAYGMGIGLDYRHNTQVNLWGNYSYARTTGDDWRVNIPEHRLNLGVQGEKVLGNFGYSLSYRWQSAFDYSSASAFGSGRLPAFGALNAQVNYAIPQWKAQVKLGGTNVLGDDYATFTGGASVGSLYYLGVVFEGLGSGVSE